MVTIVPRMLLALAAAGLAFGGVMHARAFGGTLAAVAVSDLETFYANSLRALWFIDSATLITLGVVFAVGAVRPSVMSRPVIVLLAFVPAATAFFLYKYIGQFMPAHLLLGSAAAAAIGGLGYGTAR